MVKHKAISIPNTDSIPHAPEKYHEMVANNFNTTKIKKSILKKKYNHYISLPLRAYLLPSWSYPTWTSLHTATFHRFRLTFIAECVVHLFSIDINTEDVPLFLPFTTCDWTLEGEGKQNIAEVINPLYTTFLKSTKSTATVYYGNSTANTLELPQAIDMVIIILPDDNTLIQYIDVLPV